MGKDERGRPFFEGSRTGPIFEPGAFSSYARSKGASIDVITRAEHYDNMLEIFRKGKFMRAIPNDTKVVMEVFYNPMAKIDDIGITFVTVRYDRKKLGDLMTIMPYTVLQASTGQTHPDRDKILKALYKESNQKIKIIDPNLRFGTIDISGTANAAAVMGAESIRIIKSRKHADRPAKANLIGIIQKLKDDLAAHLLSHPGIEGKFKLGPEIEGVVLHLPTAKGIVPFKITTKEFQTAHAAQKAER